MWSDVTMEHVNQLNKPLVHLLPVGLQNIRNRMRAQSSRYNLAEGF